MAPRVARLLLNEAPSPETPITHPPTRPPAILRDRSHEASWTIMNEVTKLCYEVSEADVARARNQLKASLLFLQDSSQRACPWAAPGGQRARGACLGSRTRLC